MNALQNGLSKLFSKAKPKDPAQKQTSGKYVKKTKTQTKNSQDGSSALTRTGKPTFLRRKINDSSGSSRNGSNTRRNSSISENNQSERRQSNSSDRRDIVDNREYDSIYRINQSTNSINSNFSHHSFQQFHRKTNSAGSGGQYGYNYGESENLSDENLPGGWEVALTHEHLRTEIIISESLLPLS